MFTNAYVKLVITQAFSVLLNGPLSFPESAVLESRKSLDFSTSLYGLRVYVAPQTAAAVQLRCVFVHTLCRWESSQTTDLCAGCSEAEI